MIVEKIVCWEYAQCYYFKQKAKENLCAGGDGQIYQYLVNYDL